MAGRILTNDPIRESQTWWGQTVVLPLCEEREGPARLLDAWRNVARIRHAVTPEDLVILTDSHNLSGSLYGLMRRGRRWRPTLVRTDPLLTMRCLPVVGPLRGAYLRASLQSVERINPVLGAGLVPEEHTRKARGRVERQSLQDPCVSTVFSPRRSLASAVGRPIESHGTIDGAIMNDSDDKMKQDAAQTKASMDEAAKKNRKGQDADKDEEDTGAHLSPERDIGSQKNATSSSRTPSNEI